MNAISWLIISLFFSAFTFVVGLYLAGSLVEKKCLAKLKPVKDAHLKKNTIFKIIGRFNLYWNIYLIVLKDGNNQEFFVSIPDFDLPPVDSAFVKLNENETNLISAINPSFCNSEININDVLCIE